MSCPLKTVRPCLASALVVLACNGCHVKDARDLVGTYDLNTSSAREHISVRADGGYVHFSGPSAAATMVDSGRWKFVRRRGSRDIVFDEIHVGDSHASVVWYAPVERSLRGRIRIVVDYDLGTYYLKRTNVAEIPAPAR